MCSFSGLVHFGGEVCEVEENGIEVEGPFMASVT